MNNADKDANKDARNRQLAPRFVGSRGVVLQDGVFQPVRRR